MSEVNCPWCNHEITDLWEYNLNDGDVHEIECGNCEKKVNLHLSVSYDYKAEATGCEKHAFDIGDYWFSGATFLNVKCTLCKNEFYDHALAGGKHQKLTRDQYEFVGRAKEEAEKRGLQ